MSTTDLKRQVDPLHSCIEAKCSSWNSGNYLDCIYRHCISGFQIQGRKRTLGNQSFGEPEGRFLLLPVATHSSRNHFPDILRSLQTTEAGTLVSGGGVHNFRFKRHPMQTGNDVRATKHGITLSRRYYDIEGDCVKKMCGHLEPHTIFHLQCKEQCIGISG